jgi:hypothetical protein
MLQCPINTWSAGGANVPCTQCPANTASPSTSTNIDACVCLPGYKPGASGCVQCVSGEVCPGGTSVGIAVIECPPGAISPPGSDSPAACACQAGYGKLVMDKWFNLACNHMCIHVHTHNWLQSKQIRLVSICGHSCHTTKFQFDWDDPHNEISNPAYWGILTGCQ